jgi:hypothetical protein
VRKPWLECVKDQDVLDECASETRSEDPGGVLGDLKTDTEQYPFLVPYDELHRRLSHESLIVVGSYSFGDSPLNPLARLLPRDTRNRLVGWNPVGKAGVYLSRLRR